MPAWVWILFGGFEAALLAALLPARQLWRNRADRFDERPLGEVRAYPVQMACGAAAVTLGLGLIAVERDPPSAPAVVLSGALLAVVAAGAWLTRSLRRHGRPAALVPPHLRGLRGPPEEPLPWPGLVDAD